ncbi:HAD family hydrolase [Paenibacillus lycopersici]|uniref:HAD family hydrolase n=1 Tax=Paenibacillus lycopersici TaxID=2704462 RepID=A0A6C0FUN4_9BACL|nr:HAD family hydrolase [Paenibacillus lycopersici]QHT60868.1 HAD family hydrolase [Paenibacillus lycopersici]
MYPKAIFLDLDDTIIAFDHGVDVDGCWRLACGNELPYDEETLTGIIERIKGKAKWYWSDPERHRIGRMDLAKTRAGFIAEALQEAGHGGPAAAESAAAVAERISAAFTDARDKAITMIPGALETIHHLRERGFKLALITNGSASGQRSKIDRFGLAPLFDLILIEGEFGTGKPEQAVYLHAMQELNVKAEEAWMVGDNFDWEIVAPQAVAMKGVWVNPKRLAPTGGITPFRTIETLSELRGLLDELAN